MMLGGAIGSAGAQAQDAFVDDELLRQRERDRALQERLEVSPDVRLSVPLDAVARFPEDESPCFVIHELAWQGDEVQRFAWLDDAVVGDDPDDTPLGRCLGTQGVNLVLERAQNALIERGFVTSRVLVEPQDLNEGVLTLTLVPGRIARLRVADPARPHASLRNAVPARPGDILNLRDVEQALENFQHLPSVAVDIQIAPADDQTYQGARLSTDGDLALLSDGAIHFDTASDLRSESHERSRSNFAWQSASGEGVTRETLRQSELVAQGELQIAAQHGIDVLYEARGNESLDQAIDRVVATNPDLAWLQDLQGRDDVTWESIEAFQDEWSYSQSGLSPLAAQLLSAVAAYYTAGAVSGAIGSLSGTAAGSQATFSAGAMAADGSTWLVAGKGNAIFSGMAGGAMGGGVGAASQGYDWRSPALSGAVTGGFTGYLSAGTYYNNPIHTAQGIGNDLAASNLSSLANTARYLGSQQLIGQLQQKIADGVGLSSEELNWLLMASSIGGDYLSGRNGNVRYKKADEEFVQSNNIGGRGWLHRGFPYAAFDAVDTALTYQGLPTNTIHNYLYDIDRPSEYTSYTGHSLGTGDGAYLARYGLVEHAYLHSLPIGLVAPPNADVTLGSWDMVNGGRLGLLLNWDSNVVPILPWEHPFENYKDFIEVGD